MSGSDVFESFFEAVETMLISALFLFFGVGHG